MWSPQYLRAERKLKTTHGVDLPEKIRAWFNLPRSRVSKEQRQLILTNVGADQLNLDAVGKAMNFILGQDSRLDFSRPDSDGTRRRTPPPTPPLTTRMSLARTTGPLPTRTRPTIKTRRTTLPGLTPTRPTTRRRPTMTRRRRPSTWRSTTRSTQRMPTPKASPTE